MGTENDVGMDEARLLLGALEALATDALNAARSKTARGKNIDDHQVMVEAVTYAATEARVARELVDQGVSATPWLEAIAVAGVADLAFSARHRLLPVFDDLGIDETVVERSYSRPIKTLLRKVLSEAAVRAIGRAVAESPHLGTVPVDAVHEQIRQSARTFAQKEVAPHAEHIHRDDDLLPERFISQMAELGYFGLSVPEEYGGFETGNLAMVVTTEELSRASLAAGGSLITRPEILAKALLAGGTEEQKKKWLPKIARGELMVAISVTEPDVGSDVASLKCRADKRTVGGQPGWVINGPKSWCTFGGRANIVALLARTDPDVSKGSKGLSLFIVEKDPFEGHAFEMVQSTGGKMLGKSDRTMGYRGMHSFTLSLEDYFVRNENLVGGDAGIGKGFNLQMAGFAAGRLQTAGRACGLAQAALDATASYVTGRSQFGKPIIEFGLTQYKLGRMAMRVAAARAVAYAAARAMDDDERAAAPLAAQAKLFACDVAVEVTQEGQLLHGGWGYAEEYAISRYVADALVLPIFEGVKPILELKVIGRHLLGGGA